MRILMLADTPPNPDSGAAGTDYQTLAALRRKGHEVDALWADSLPHRIRHGNLHYLLELPYAYARAVAQALSRRTYDVVQISQPHGYLAARHISRLPGRRPIHVHRSHGFEARVAAVLAPWERKLQPRAPLPRRLMRATMAGLLEWNNRAITRQADGHIVSSSLCGDFLRARYAVPPERIAVIAQAAPDGYITAQPPPMTRERLHRVLYVGQWVFAKGGPVLVDAFARIAGASPQATLTWVCDARDHAAAAHLVPAHLRDRVSFIGSQDQASLMGLYDSHGVFLFPSFFEGFGKAFLEAMARGMVVCASREGGARDLIAQGSNGFTSAPGDAETMARQCLAVMADPERASRIGLEARRTAALHTWDRVADESTSFYQRLMAIR